MKKTLRLVVKIAGLLAVYMFMQALFQTLATFLMISLSDLPADTVNFIYDAEYLNNHLVVQDCMTDAIALSTLLSTVAMLLFIHLQKLPARLKAITTNWTTSSSLQSRPTPLPPSARTPSR